jgi:hypothetical protein
VCNSTKEQEIESGMIWLSVYTKLGLMVREYLGFAYLVLTSRLVGWDRHNLGETETESYLQLLGTNESM